jgi:hypothetical protein
MHFAKTKTKTKQNILCSERSVSPMPAISRDRSKADVPAALAKKKPTLRDLEFFFFFFFFFFFLFTSPQAGIFILALHILTLSHKKIKCHSRLGSVARNAAISVHRRRKRPRRCTVGCGAQQPRKKRAARRQHGKLGLTCVLRWGVFDEPPPLFCCCYCLPPNSYIFFHYNLFLMGAHVFYFIFFIMIFLIFFFLIFIIHCSIPSSWHRSPM